MPRVPPQLPTLDYERSHDRRRPSPWVTVAIVALFGLVFATSCGAMLSIAYGLAKGMRRLRHP